MLQDHISGFWSLAEQKKVMNERQNKTIIKNINKNLKLTDTWIVIVKESNTFMNKADPDGEFAIPGLVQGHSGSWLRDQELFQQGPELWSNVPEKC